MKIPQRMGVYVQKIENINHQFIYGPNWTTMPWNVRSKHLSCLLLIQCKIHHTIDYHTTIVVQSFMVPVLVLTISYDDYTDEALFFLHLGHQIQLNFCRPKSCEIKFSQGNFASWFMVANTTALRYILVFIYVFP